MKTVKDSINTAYWEHMLDHDIEWSAADSVVGAAIIKLLNATETLCETVYAEDGGAMEDADRRAIKRAAVHTCEVWLFG